MKNILLLGALFMFAFTSSAQTDAPASSGKEKTEKVECSKKDGEKKACCAKTADGDKKACTEAQKAECAKSGDKKACCSKTAEGEKKACCSKSTDGDKKSSCSKSKEEDKKAKTKTVSITK
jgi:hypothetical protein